MRSTFFCAKRILRRLTEGNAEVARIVPTTNEVQEASIRVEQNPRERNVALLSSPNTQRTRDIAADTNVAVVA